MSGPKAVVFGDVACTMCGCVCDDLQVAVEGGRIASVNGACHLSESWFLEQGTRQPPAAQVEGRAVKLDAAVERAAEILCTARWPLVFGLSRSSTDGQRAAVRLADAARANIDTTASLCHAPSIMAIQQVGESTCTLGEIKNRADLVIFWGVDPARTHPRHFERYSVDAAGFLTPRGREDRSLVVIDSQPTESSAAADQFLQIGPDEDFEAIWTLRCLIRGMAVPEIRGGTRADRDRRAQLELLAEQMRSCRCGVFFFGLGLAGGDVGHCKVTALLQLVCDLNAHTRFHARRMRLHGDVTGADMVLCWQTGFPFSVSLSRGYPRYGPHEYSANELLARGEADACLLVGGESVPQLSDAARSHLKRIPTVLLDYPTAPLHFSPTVQFTTAVYGVHLPGTAYRMDEVPIPLRAMLPSTYPGDAEVLQSIEQTLVSKQRSQGRET